jgi:hypothetical protein
MYYVEDALTSLIVAGFTLDEASECAKAIQKTTPDKIEKFYQSFIAKGGLQTQWNAIVDTLKAGRKYIYEVALSSPEFEKWWFAQSFKNRPGARDFKDATRKAWRDSKLCSTVNICALFYDVVSDEERSVDKIEKAVIMLEETLNQLKTKIPADTSKGGICEIR